MSRGMAAAISGSPLKPVAGSPGISQDRPCQRRRHPGLAAALDYMRDGMDTLVVWKLDRPGRSTKDILHGRGQAQ
ncbi:hypothetical protein GB883_04330 [Georgenia thermotolerans]|uniref:Resolvase/invertase-type recombinase catalytic domain-containing protein n=1 Tax=Georgenia thermotolerans TaxID=527326 RepID=A0A7J5USG2_9MICO|nr:hypothetical protein GB883_04330 [Georgenia thermotolerans]